MEVFAEDEVTVLKTFATVELPWLGNENGISCIPSGEYLVKKNYFRPKIYRRLRIDVTLLSKCKTWGKIFQKLMNEQENVINNLRKRRVFKSFFSLSTLRAQIFRQKIKLSISNRLQNMHIGRLHGLSFAKVGCPCKNFQNL